MAGAAFAGNDNSATISQIDSYNSASVTQGGSDNQATVVQSQGAFGAQRNPSNISNSDQEGENGSLSVIQVGNNSSSISQLDGSSNEIALVGQSNNFNSSTISQAGSSEFAVVNQEEGTGNSASIVQHGTGDGANGPQSGAVRAGPDLWRNENVPSDSVLAGAITGSTDYGPVGAIVDQQGFNNSGAINQRGLDNFADVSQGNQDGSANNIASISQSSSVMFSDAVTYQDGQNNIASINQSGSGPDYSIAWQIGNSNQAYTTQSHGSNSSVIEQGASGLGTYGNAVPTPGTPVTSDYASVDQSGGGDSSHLQQTGSEDTGLVTQSGANSTSTITQGGSFNTAVVHQ